MLYISEQTAKELVDQAAVTQAVNDAFVGLANNEASNWPIVRETLGYADAIFGFKSGFNRSLPALGLKAGGLWPGNASKGLLNHQSTVLLFDPDTGAPKALVRANYLTALRTAAASALSIRHLAKKDAKVLGIIGAGGQAEYQLAAALNERSFSAVHISSRNPSKANVLASSSILNGCDVHVSTPEALARACDVIITITPSRDAILEIDWIQPGTHIAAMGTDTVGKQELDPSIMAWATLFGDEASEAVHLGECQHAYKSGLISEDDITTLGHVIGGTDAGRSNDDEVTVFDSTGMALQDFAACDLALCYAQNENRAIQLD